MGSGFLPPLTAAFEAGFCRNIDENIASTASVETGHVIKSVLHLPCNILQLRLVDTFQEGYWFLMVLELIGGGDLFTATGLAWPHRVFFCSLTVHSDIAMTEIPNNLILMPTRAFFNPSFPFHFTSFQKEHMSLPIFAPFICLPLYAAYCMYQTAGYMYIYIYVLNRM